MSFVEALRRVQHYVATQRQAQFAAAAFFVLITVALRTALDPVFRPGVYYHLYYPAVILACYWWGARVGLFTVALSAASGYFLFSAPIFAIKTNPQAYVPLLSFMASSLVAVYVLSHLRSQLRFLTKEYNRIDALTVSQAGLFREHAERVSNHLQLISALLQIHARTTGSSGDVGRVMRNAASRALHISRIHRAFARPETDRIDFKAFATRVADAALVARGRPPVTVVVEGDRLDLPLEHASSLGILLIECVNARAALGAPGLLVLALESQGQDGILSITDRGLDDGAKLGRDMTILAAIAEQMSGALVLSSDADTANLRLSFPIALQPLPNVASFSTMH